MLSAANGHLEVVRILIEHGADLNIKGKVSHNRPLYACACMYVCV